MSIICTNIFCDRFVACIRSFSRLSSPYSIRAWYPHHLGVLVPICPSSWSHCRSQRDLTPVSQAVKCWKQQYTVNRHDLSVLLMMIIPTQLLMSDLVVIDNHLNSMFVYFLFLIVSAYFFITLIGTGSFTTW